MKIVIADPTISGLVTIPCMGVLYVAAMLEKGGHDVSVYFRSITDNWDRIGEYVAKENPDLVGVTCLQSLALKDALKTVKEIRNLCDAPIMMGGVHATVRYKEMLTQCPDIDVIALHEAEYTSVDIAHAVEQNEPFSTIKGVAYRDNGTIKVTEKRPFIENLDDLPFPARHLVPLEKFQYSSRGNMITSRGCPFGCVHCCVPAMQGLKFRARSPQNIVAEMRELAEVYNLDYSKFVDDTFSFDKNRIVEICNLLIEDPVDITWGCKVRSDRIDENLLGLLKEAGCVELFYATESASQKTLDLLGKKEKVERLEEAIKLTQKAGIRTAGFVHIALPFETKEEVLKTLQFVEDLNLDRLGIQVMAASPGCKVYDNFAEYGITPLGEDCIPDYEYNPAVLPTIETSELTKEDIIELIMNAVQVMMVVNAKQTHY